MTPVHPSDDKLEGIKTIRSLTELPNPTETAVSIITPAKVSLCCNVRIFWLNRCLTRSLSTCSNKSKIFRFQLSGASQEQLMLLASSTSMRTGWLIMSFSKESVYYETVTAPCKQCCNFRIDRSTDSLDSDTELFILTLLSTN